MGGWRPCPQPQLLVDEIRVGAAGVGIEPVITVVVGQMENTLSPVP